MYVTPTARSSLVRHLYKRISDSAILGVFGSLTRMEPELFCENWLLDSLAPEYREEAKHQRGYRAKCLRILSIVLRKPVGTVDSWGPNFERMPADCKTTLSYVDALRSQLKTSPREVLDLFFEKYTLE